MVQAVGFGVVTARDYPVQLLALIRAAKYRIILAAMTVRAGPETREILQALVSAARRGVHVHVVADVFCQHMVNKPHTIGRHEFKERCAETRELLGEIHSLGGTVDWAGRMHLNPYAGRYHAKVTVIDDHVFAFGGINMCDDAFANTDYMLYAVYPKLAELLQASMVRYGAGAVMADNEMPLNSQETVLLDAGKPGESIIYQRACSLAANAAHVTYVSQMCPSGQLARAIQSTRNTCYFNKPRQTGISLDTLAQLWDNWRTGMQNHYEGSAYIHAKCMLFEMHDGTKVSLSGSHNFSWRGVAFGTKEIALQSSDPRLWRKLQDVIYAVATAGGTR